MNCKHAILTAALLLAATPAFSQEVPPGNTGGGSGNTAVGTGSSALCGDDLIPDPVTGLPGTNPGNCTAVGVGARANADRQLPWAGAAKPWAKMPP